MKHNVRLEVPRIKAGEPCKIGLLVEVSAPELPVTEVVRNPQAIIFVVDRSGSMGDGRLDLVKNTISEIVGRLSDRDYLSIVSFDTEVEVHVPMAKVGELNPTQIRRDLMPLQPRGGTNVELGFIEGLKQVSLAPEGIESRVILLSDGHANSGQTHPEAFGRLAANATEHLVRTSTIGIGDGYDEKILASLADSGQGNHFAAVELDEAVTGLQDEIEGLMQRSLSNLRVKVTVPNAIKGLKINPVGFTRAVEKLETGVEVRFGDQVSGETRGYGFLIDLPSLRREQGKELKFTVEVSGTEIESGKNQLKQEQLVLEIAEREGFIAPAKDEDVSAEIAAYRLTEIKKAAAEAAWSGNHELAKHIIRGAQRDIEYIIKHVDRLSPRLRARILAEQQELKELLEFKPVEFSKRAYESSLRTARSKRDPRKGH